MHRKFMIIFTQNLLRLKKAYKNIIFLIFLIVSTLLLWSSYHERHGYAELTTSIEFLTIAKNILKGIGPYHIYLNLHDGGPMYSSYPQLGYSYAIAGIAFLSGLDVFWASKIVNIIFLLIMIALLCKYHRNGRILSLALFFATYLLVYIHTWAETGAMLGYLSYAIFSSKIISNNNVNKKYFYYSALAIFFAFLFRGQGLFLLLPHAVGFIFLVIKRRPLLHYFLSTLMLICLVGMYYINIYIHNPSKLLFNIGIDNVLSSAILFKYLLFSLLVELIPITSIPYPGGIHFLLFLISALVALSIILILLFVKNLRIPCPMRDRNSDDRYDDLYEAVWPKVFSVIGVSYLCVLIWYVWTHYCDPFGYRFLCLGTVLLWIAIIDLMLRIKTKGIRHFINTVLIVFVSLSICSALIFPACWRIYRGQNFFSEMDKIRKYVKKIPENAFVFSLESYDIRYMQYVRSDLLYLYVWDYGRFSQDIEDKLGPKPSLLKLIQNIKEKTNKKGIYFIFPEKGIDVPFYYQPERLVDYHESVRKFCEDHVGEGIVYYRFDELMKLTDNKS